MIMNWKGCVRRRVVADYLRQDFLKWEPWHEV